MATMAATMVGTAVGVARVAAVMVAGVDALEAWKGAGCLETSSHVVSG